MSNRSRKRMRLQRGRKRRAGNISEFAAALMILLPILLTVGFAAAEANQVYMVKSALNYCASVASRKLAIAYGLNPTGTVGNEQTTFDTVRYSGMVVSNQQFQVPTGTAGWNTTGNPGTVTVVVKFQGGQYGLPDFPSPDPLGLGQGLVLSSSSTSVLE